MTKKFIKCFTDEEKQELIKRGFDFLYEQNHVFYFKNSKNTNFSDVPVLKNVSFTNTLNF